MRYKIFIIIALLSVAVYANSIPNGFVYDDDIYVVENPNIRDIKNIPASFVHPEYLTSLGHKSHYRPLVMISYTINYWIGGLNPAVYRITNLLFHIGTAFLLFLTVEAILHRNGEIRGLTSYHFIALASALIFAVHPFNSEAVNYITARSSLMSGFFYLLAFYFWVRYRGTTQSRETLHSGGVGSATTPVVAILNSSGGAGYFYFASLLGFILGVLSKEVVITLPLALWLYDVSFRRLSLINWRTYVPHLPFILLIAIALVVRSVYEGGGIIPYLRRDIATQVFTMMPVLTAYLKLLFLPTGLSIAHYVEVYHTPAALPVIISALILFLYVINSVYLYMRKEAEWRLLSYFMTWYLVTLLIIVIVPLNRGMQENRCYISGAVFAVFLGVVIGGIIYSRHRNKLAYGILAVLIVLYGVGTVYRTMVWKNEVTLWTDAMAKSPNEPLVYNNLSVAYSRGPGDYEKAKDTLYRGIRRSPGDWLLHYNLGALYKMTGELDSALDAFDRAMTLNPKVAVPVNVEKGDVYLLKDDIGKGMGLFQEAIKVKPEYATAHYYMAKALRKLGRREEAEKELDLALRFANASYNRRLAERITRYRDEGYMEKGVIPEIPGIPQ